jgi:hypothetical protein
MKHRQNMNLRIHKVKSLCYTQKGFKPSLQHHGIHQITCLCPHFPPKSKRKKKLDPPECSNASQWVHENYGPETVCHHFQLTNTPA